MPDRLDREMVNKLRSILATLLDDPDQIKTIQFDTDLISEVGLDSLQMIKFLLMTEDEFDIEIDYENLDIAHLVTLNHFSEYIKGQQSAVVAHG